MFAFFLTISCIKKCARFNVKFYDMNISGNLHLYLKLERHLYLILDYLCIFKDLFLIISKEEYLEN